MNAQENLAMEVAAEVKRAQSLFAPINGPHEGLGVIMMGGEVIKRKSMMKYEIKISTKTLDSGRVLAPKYWFEKLCRLLSRKYPGQILYHSADYTHDVTTLYGLSWSIVLTGPKSRNWGFMKCEG